MSKTRYVSVDIEATGPAPGVFSMVSIGACVVGETERQFYAELKPITDRFDKKALRVAMPRRTHDSLYETGEDPGEVMHRFTNWLKELREHGTYHLVCVAHNAPFDWMFLTWYFFTYVGENPFGWAALDTRALFMGLTGNAWEKTRLEDIKKRYPMQKPHTHHALEDAIEQGELFEQMLETHRALRLKKGSEV